ncbi:MAG: GNAT family N-acetyltransferase [Clostridia bacterium]|nr:GNAT family N-acetyltransferase [Clostridia bacterium]
MNITIRKARTDDCEKIRPLQKEIADLHYKGRPDIFREQPPYFSEEDFARMCEDQSAVSLIAKTEEGEVVGYAFCKVISFRNHPRNRDFDCFYIDDICVLQTFRRQGIGRRLMNRCREEAIARKCKMMNLNVWAFNEEAIAFYESFGMTTRTKRMELILED